MIVKLSDFTLSRLRGSASCSIDNNSINNNSTSYSIITNFSNSNFFSPATSIFIPDQRQNKLKRKRLVVLLSRVLFVREG